MISCLSARVVLLQVLKASAEVLGRLSISSAEGPLRVITTSLVLGEMVLMTSTDILGIFKGATTDSVQ